MIPSDHMRFLLIGSVTRWSQGCQLLTWDRDGESGAARRSVCVLHNVPWFQLVGKAKETGLVRRSGSGDTEEKHCAASKTHLPSRPWSPRKRGKKWIIRACSWTEHVFLMRYLSWKTHLTYFGRTWSECASVWFVPARDGPAGLKTSAIVRQSFVLEF